jgi:general secretion pathway protein G
LIISVATQFSPYVWIWRKDLFRGYVWLTLEIAQLEAREMKNRNGFTLIELVVVVMILGILAAIAIPKLINTSKTATDNGLKQTLSVVRDAIELYVADNSGTLPGQSDLAADLKNYLRGDFPICPVGPAQNATIKYSNSGTPLSGSATPTEGWHYDKKSGEFICNFNGATASDPLVSYDEL